MQALQAQRIDIGQRIAALVGNVVPLSIGARLNMGFLAQEIGDVSVELGQRIGRDRAVIAVRAMRRSCS